MDLIIHNGKIVTMDPKLPEATWVLIKDGKISEVGKTGDPLKFKNPETKIIDLEGKLMLPGFNDSHMHLLNYGASLVKCNLINTPSLDELINKMKHFIKEKSFQKGHWVEGRGWNHDQFTEKRFPSKYDLDKISTDYPIIATRACGHVTVVNSKALELAGITKDTPQIEGGHFDLDEHGEPTGVFREKALNLILEKIPEPSVEDIKDLLLMASEKVLAQGITSVQSDDFEAMPGKDYLKVIEAYKQLAAEKKLPIRVYQQCLLPTVDKLNSFLEKGFNTGVGDDWYKMGPLKVLADGSLGARTAYLSKPYADDPTTQGISIYTQEQLDELIKKAHDSKMQVAIHCIGDGIMYMAFESYEKAQRDNPRKDHRHSIIHCQITDETLLDKYRDQGVVAHIQPIFIDYDLHIVEARVGKELASTSYNWKSMLDRGVHVACGSDSPVETLNVLQGIYCAVTRKDLKGYPEEGWLPDQKLTVEEAVHGYTLGAAYASFEENIKGSITTGKLADFVILSEDIFGIEPDRIKDVKVLQTIVGGK